MKLPSISGEKIIKILTKQDFRILRQKGSHVSLHKRINNKNYLVVVPLKKTIKKGTLLSIIKQAGLEREEFLELVK
jgi:predicted RNA binding protein YcfA (HicA-like mRNA interferase family)